MLGSKIYIEFDRNEPFAIELDRIRNEEETVSKFVEWFGDNRTRQYLPGLSPVTPGFEMDFFKKVTEDKDIILWFIYINNTLIGNISLNKIDRSNGNTELGIVIGDKNYWGKGIAPVIETTVIDYAFSNIIPGGLNKVYAKACHDNSRSWKALMKAGMEEIGVQKEHIWQDGKFHDMWLGETLKKDWTERKSQIFENLCIKNIDLYPGLE